METLKFKTAGLEKETEKAICVKMNLVNPKSDKEFVKFQWLPKSVCQLIEKYRNDQFPYPDFNGESFELNSDEYIKIEKI